LPREKTTKKLEVIGEVKGKKTTGTLITFLPDPTIFTITTEFKFERLATRLRELAFLNPGLEINLTDRTRRVAKKGNISLQTRHRRIRKAAWRKQTSAAPEPIVISRQRDEVFVDVVLQYNDSYNDQILPFANSIPNPDGRNASHRLRTALTKAVNQYAKAKHSAQRKRSRHLGG